MARHPETDLYRCAACTHAFSHLDSVREFERYEPNYYDADHQRWFKNPNISLFERIAKAIPTGASILDVGCGRGDFLRHLRRIRPDLRLAGIDLSPNQDADIRFFQGDVMEADPKEQFDAVVSLAVIEHISNVRGFIDRLARLTKPGGVVTVMTVNESSILYALARVGKRLGMPLAFNRLYGRHHLHHFTRESLRRLLATGGFAIEQEIVLNSPLAAVDIPTTNKLVGTVLRSGMWMVSKAGEMTNRSYLQVIICRANDVPSAAETGRS